MRLKFTLGYADINGRYCRPGNCNRRDILTMLKNIRLDRPLAVLDLETTGTDPKLDRIIEISVLRVLPGGGHDHRTRRVNPGVPIPSEATAIHGISDDDVADCPAFRAIAPSLVRFLDGCDLAGFNILNFDLRLLVAEFNRVGLVSPWLVAESLMPVASSTSESPET